MTDRKYYFYHCKDESYSNGEHTYIDHTHGIAGYDRVQPRARYIGHLTEKELDLRLKNTTGSRLERNGFSRRRVSTLNGYGDRL